MPSLAPHMLGVPGSGIRRIHEIAITLDDVIMLAVGEPDVPVGAGLMCRFSFGFCGGVAFLA